MNVCLIRTTPMEGFHGQAVERVYVQAGMIRVADSPTLFRTILGSSVAVCLWSPRIAGVSHFILPRGGHHACSRYGNHALPMLLDEMLRAGADRREILAAVFGGAKGLGDGNVREATDFLTRHAIPLMRREVGGCEGRTLTFRSVDGSSIVRLLGGSA